MSAGRIEAFGAVVPVVGGPIHVEPIEIDLPGPGEVLVRIVASGVCHSDRWAVANGNWGLPFPMLLGHEGAGVVEAVGSGVSHVAEGDSVLLAWAVPCGSCRSCRRGARRRCEHAWTQPPRLRRGDGSPLQGTLSLGTLATHTVVHAEQLIRLPPGSDLTSLCLLGCGVSTGVGAAVNTAGVWPGSTVAVIGLGGIGLAAVQGARIAGAKRVIAIDLIAAKLDAARGLGATETVDASAGDPVSEVMELTDGVGVDATFEATGDPTVVGQAVEMLARAGIAVAIGVPPPSSEVTFRWSGDGGGAYARKVSLLVTDGGDPLRQDFETWVGWVRDGRLDLDRMVTRVLSLTDAGLEEAFRAMLAGEVIRSVVRVTDP